MPNSSHVSASVESVRRSRKGDETRPARAVAGKRPRRISLYMLNECK
jgi:hypothetical protein